MHDEVKDKMFELELSWVGEFTDGVHKRVPEEVSIRTKMMNRCRIIGFGSTGTGVCENLHLSDS